MSDFPWFDLIGTLLLATFLILAFVGPGGGDGDGSLPA